MTHVKKGEAYDRLTDHSQSRSDTEIYHVIMSKSCGMRCNSAITWMAGRRVGTFSTMVAVPLMVLIGQSTSLRG